jgi:subtilase-type serine protease|tara:strand:- start:51312 stop:54092 length:2781 start_codon:yes stop_codon:yes gene_type:complete
MTRPTTRLIPVALATIAALAFTQAKAENFDTAEYRQQYGLGMINAAQAYQQGFTGQGVRVGVMDSGIFSLHPEFQGRIDGGWDLYNNRAITQTWGLDLEGHGTHVSGIIAADRNNIGMHGVAFNSKVVMIRMDDDGVESGEEEESYEQEDLLFARGWNRAATFDLPILNASLGYNDCDPDDTGSLAEPCNILDYDNAQNIEERYPLSLEGLRALTDVGTLMVISTGNEQQPSPDMLAGLPHYFDEFEDNWIAVAALAEDGLLAGYSNHCGVAAQWCISAPGGDWDEARGIYSTQTGGGYVRMSGTSMAAPHVAGAAALVKEAFPFFQAYHLQQTLLTTATDIGTAGVDSTYGWGALNVGKAVKGPGAFTDDFAIDTLGYDTTFSNDIGGNGKLIKLGQGSITLTGSNGYQGGTEIVGGKVVMNGIQSSTTTVQGAGTLGGTGSIQDVHNYGVVAPGNSIGTLKIFGDYTAYPGSRLEIEVNGNNATDVLQVTGNVQLDGTLALEGGPFRQGIDYNFLAVMGGAVSGNFADIDTDLVFLSPNLRVNNSGAILEVQRNSVPFSRYLTSSNQIAVTNALDTLSNSPPAAMGTIFDELLNSTPGSVAGIAGSLSGEAHASVQSTLLQSAYQRTGRLSERIGSAQDMAAASSAYPLWVSVDNQWQTMNGRNGTADTRYRDHGFTLGGDFAIGPDWRAGLALGYSDGRIETDDLQTSTDADNYVVSLYSGKSWRNGHSRLNLLVGASLSRHNLDAQRTVSTGGVQTLTTDYHGYGRQVFAELGYAFAVTPTSMLEPYASVAWSSLKTQGFTESGGAAALAAKSQTDNVGTMTLGIRGLTHVDVGKTQARLRAGLGWRYAAGDLAPKRRMQFVAAPAAAYTVEGVALARNALVVELGAEVDLGRYSALGVSYGGQFGDGTSNSTGSVNLRVRF